ncbi:hypothetical protein SAMN04487934_10153 [Eubacterium ruminantium]|nr:hypothetical protein SAMN04487934_10153 [Eubacterium ruminantium]
MKKSNIEQKLYKYSIKQLPGLIIGFYIIGYFLYFAAPDFYMKLVLNPYYIVENNEYWRLITWIFSMPFSPDDAWNIIFIPISLFFYYFVAKRLEAAWGTVMFNIFILGGLILIDVSVLLTAFITLKWNVGDYYTYMMNVLGSSIYGVNITYFTTMSMFLAFAVIFGEQVVMLYFMIPLKVKWLGYFDLAYLIYEFIKAKNVFARVIIVASVANFIIFYIINKKRSGSFNLEQKKRQRDFQRRIKAANIQAVHRGEGNSSENDNVSELRRQDVRRFSSQANIIPAGQPIHRCAVCGRTEKDDENLEFRYCSKCNGAFEYCMDHIFTHEHKK